MTPATTETFRDVPAAVERPVDVVVVEGPDARAYLQGQLSQEVEELPEGASAPALLLQPNGKLTAWLRVLRTGEDRYELVVDPGAGEAVRARLARFKLRTDAEIALEPRAGLAVRGPGAAAVPIPPGALTVPAGWLGVEGVDWIRSGGAGSSTPIDPGPLPVLPSSALEALRIECGVPAMGAELREATIPAEAGQWVIDASVSFTKGCYAGQELVARIDSRGGNVPRPVRGLVVAGSGPEEPAVLVGASIEAGGAGVGTVTSAGRSPALGVIALGLVGRAVEPGTEVRVVAAAGSWEAEVRTVPLR